MSIGKRLKDLRLQHKMTLDEAAKSISVARQTLFKYENEIITNIPSDKIERLATLYGVLPSYIMGWDEHPKSVSNNAFADAVIIEMPESVLVPVYGRIKAGVPLEAIEDIEEHIDVPAKWIQAGRKIIGLRVDGNSMYPRYFHNDIVVIECDTTYISGDDCAVYVNGYEATIKTIKFHSDGIELIPVNTVFPPQRYKQGEYSILGKVIEMRRRF